MMNVERAIERALARIDSDAVTRLAVELVSIPSATGAERPVATFLAEHMERGGLEVSVYGSCRRHFEELIGPYERCTSPLASYSDDTCIMREQAIDSVVFGPGGVRYRGEADGQGMGAGGEAVSIDDMVNVARVYAATAVDTCSKPRDVLKIRDQWAEEPA